jgi:hypothetical protein
MKKSRNKLFIEAAENTIKRYEEAISTKNYDQVSKYFGLAYKCYYCNATISHTTPDWGKWKKCDICPLSVDKQAFSCTNHKTYKHLNEVVYKALHLPKEYNNILDNALKKRIGFHKSIIKKLTQDEKQRKPKR